MPELQLPLDPSNPGLFYACCGLFELYEAIEPGGTALFVTGGRQRRRAEFRLRTKSNVTLEQLIAELRKCEFEALEHAQPTIAPARFRWFGHDVILNWWLDDENVDKRPLKPWGGQQTGVGVLQALTAALPERISGEHLFDLAQYTTTRLGVDPRSAWNKLDCGYSPNEREVKEARSAPAVDLLAAIGLQGFRPGRDNRHFVYALWRMDLPRVVARAAAAGALRDMPRREYEFLLLDRGQGYKAFGFGKERQRTSK
jgi:hypothetical protein